MNSADVAAKKPRVLPLMIGVDSGAVTAELFALFNDKLALLWPFVMVFGITARHGGSEVRFCYVTSRPVSARVVLVFCA